MKTNDIIHGFRVRYAQPLPELKATLYRMEFEKNGADLVWLDRQDENKTFAITFKTIPQDDTGVFHILEHSVLCGSRKYPVKEPFVELIKSSLQTFLNAFTFPDKTMYPLSSRNEQDFLNLMDVYLDAVFHPLSVEDPHAFRQEGWHYELESAQGELHCNGVVYNEMKGAYASPDTVMEGAMNRLLFPDNCYCCESGGHPDHIPELTYEEYLESHRRFYHPSNARIFLDGTMDLDGVLAKLEGFLQDYDRLAVNADIPMQQPVTPEELICPYEIGPEEDEENKAILAAGWVYGDYTQQAKNLACSVLAQVLCGSNEAPLKKALLERGLAEDVEFAPMDGIQQQMVLLVVRNTKAEQREQVWQVVRETLQQQVEQGLDHKQLRAVLNHFEYSTREKEFSSMPAGLVYAMSSMESWLYGGDPAQNLCHDEVFRTLREGIDQGCFEQFLREALLENPHHATVCMIPSKTVGAENRQKEKARLAQIKAGLSEGQCCQMAAEFDAFRERQSAPDTAEQLATLPMLSLSDIQEDSRPIRQEEQVRGGVTVLHHPLETDGILHLELYFSVADLPQEQMPLLSFFAKLLGEAATEHYSVTELSSEIDDKLGRFFVVPTVFSKVDQRDSAEPYLVVRLSMLESQKEEAVRLLDEVLNRSSFADQNFLLHFLRQNRMSLEQSVTMSGNSFAAMRVGGSLSPRGALSEAMQGIQYLRWLQETERSLESDGQALSQALAGLLQTCFLRQRVTVNVTGPLDEAWVDRVLAVLPEGNMGAPATYHSLPLRREGFLIPAEIGFAGKVGWVDDLRAANVGAAQVAAQLLTYDYLWNTIRVQGGAYGTSLGLRQEGEAVFTTYRDPSPAQSLVTFDQSGQALRDFCASEDTVERYIISTIAAGDPLMSPRLEGTFGARCYFTGLTLEERQRVRSAVLHTTKEQLASFSHQLDEACAHAGVCVIGGKHVIEECGQTLDTVSSVQ